MRAAASCLYVARVHTSKDLPGVDQVSLVHLQLDDPLRELGVDVDLVGLEPSVPRHNAGGELRLLQLPPADPGPNAKSQRQGADDEREEPAKAADWRA